MSPVKIAPSIASADQSRLGWAVQEAERGGADLIHLDIDLSQALRRVMHFLVKFQQRGDIRADIRPEVLMAAFDILNSLQHDPKVRGLYEDAGTLAAAVFKLFYYGALPAHHREAGLSETGAGPITEE